MKPNRVWSENQTPGTVLGERLRAGAGKLADAECERLGDDSLTLDGGFKSRR